MLRDVFAYIFFKPDPAKRMYARKVAKEHTHELLDHIKNHLKEASSNGVGCHPTLHVILSNVVSIEQDLFYNIIHFFHNSGKDQSLEFLKKISENKKSRDELANDVFSLVLLASVEFSQGMFQKWKEAYC